MNIAVVDDEQHCTDRIIALLEPYRSRVEVITYNTPEAAVMGMNEVHPDIVFLDVQLQGQTGFDVLQAISDRNFALIFTTAYEKYAINAFKFAAIDYLLKPVDEEDFINAMERAIEKSRNVFIGDRINTLLSNLSGEQSKKKISIPYNNGYIILDINDITRCQADINYSHIFSSEQKKYITSKPLKYFEGLLAGCGFFRIHNSHLVNLNYVKLYAKSGYVTLSDNTKLEVSVRKREAFLKVLGEL
ncbi:LytR/AlgR family response regulator transcription factor [Arenibacter algicola]|uniref:Transcriptional regulatory protein YehT n=1 Tax=Arenibacter algicola TaxID=616991 RepID=A0A221UZM0_9FLAO|nr:LytTR family DNA-binding domain-containing protein [Arenibacter algicola]ASO06784.1 transcriptional regulatory protein YehT [Arenibacter algicola]